MVAAASREARRSGIRVGMPLAQAAIRCADGIFLEGAFDAYFAASLHVDEILRRRTSDIEWQSIDEVFVGLASHPRTLSPIHTAEEIQSDIRALGFDVSLGLAQSKLVARIASRLARPRGVVQVLDGYEARFLSPLKIEMLPDVDAALARRLRAAGIRRLGQIARLSEPHLSQIAGPAGAGLARHAAGIDASRIRRTAMPPARIAERQLAAPSADTAVVHAALAAETERLGRELRSRGVFARTLTLRLRFADGRVDSRTMPLAEATALDGSLLAGGTALLARLWSGERMIRALGMSCAGLLSGAGDATLFPIHPARQPNR